MICSTTMNRKVEPIPHYTAIICVFACATIPKYKDQILKIKETWYKRALEKNMLVLFFLGEEPVPDMIGDEYVYLKGVSNDYLSASTKQNLGIKYIVEQSIEGKYDYDWIHMCGTDTFLVIDRLETYVLKYFPNNKSKHANVAIGGHGDYRTIDPGVSTYFFSGGPGFLLSNMCSKLIYPYLEQMFETWTRKCMKGRSETLVEDPSAYSDGRLKGVQRNMETNNEWLITGCDLALCYYLQTITHTEMIKDDSHFFSCNYLGYPCHIGQVPTDFVACHSMSLQDFDDYQAILHEYGMC